MTISYDNIGNVYALSTEIIALNPMTYFGTIYTELDTGKRKVGVNGKLYGELAYTSAGSAGLKRTLIVNDTITLTTLFQPIISYVPSAPMTVQGWIDINEMQDGDTLIIEVSLNDKVHSLIQYANAQVMPILHVDNIIIGFADTYKVRVKQTLGEPINISFKFFTEE